MRRTWIKIYCNNWLRGSIRKESIEVRATFIDLLAMAGDSAYGENGEIKLANGIGFSDEVIMGILNINEQIWTSVKHELAHCINIKERRIKIIEQKQGYSIKIINWGRYQSEYERVKKYKKDTKKIQKRYGVDIDLDKDIEVDIEKKKKKREDTKKQLIHFENIWRKYPNPIGKKRALKYFLSSVKTEEDWVNINIALTNYVNTEKVKSGYIQNGSTWFNNWCDYVNYVEPKKKSSKLKVGDL